MKKQIVSTLLALCMLLCLMPTAAFAEESTETPPVCSCETACTADNMNKECPVCGAENAIPQNCGQYIPVEDRTGENSSTEGADDPDGATELSAADQVQAMINALPSAEAITEDNTEEVKAQLEAIDEAKAQLSDEELDQLDSSLYTEAASALGGLAKPMLTDSPQKISVRMNAYKKECSKCRAAQQQAGAEQPGQSLRFVGCISEYDKVPAVRFQPQKPQVRICQHAALCAAVYSFLRRLPQKFSIGQIIVAAACRFDRAILGH